MQSENENRYRYVPALNGNNRNTNNVRINLAKSLDEVAVLLLIALFSSASYPMNVLESEVNQEITNLLDAEDWNQLAFKGLKWIQEITSG
jgi:hypothetical protein